MQCRLRSLSCQWKAVFVVIILYICIFVAISCFLEKRKEKKAMFGEGERLDQIMSSLSQKTGLRYLQRLSVDPQNVGLSYVFPLSYRVRQLLNSKHTYEVYIYVYIIYSGIYVYIVLYNVWGILQSELNRLMFSLAGITGDHIK